MNQVYQFRNFTGTMIVHSTDNKQAADELLSKLPFTPIENKVLCAHTQFEYELTVFKAEQELSMEDLQEHMCGS